MWRFQGIVVRILSQWLFFIYSTREKDLFVQILYLFVMYMRNIIQIWSPQAEQWKPFGSEKSYIKSWTTSLQSFQN